MTVTVRIPTPLRELTGQKNMVEAQGGTVAELIGNLDAEFKGIKERICDTNGEVRRFVNIFVNDEDIRFLDNTETALNDGDDVSILPAIAGG